MKIIYLLLALGTLAPGLHAQQKTKTAGNSVTTTTILGGIFSAPTGTNIILQNNGKNDLSLVAKKGSEINFTENAFSFPTPVPVDSKFKVVLKKIPSSQNCSIY